MRKMGLFKFRSPFRGTGKPEQTKSEDSWVEKSSVNKEYVEAFRTKSYTDMLNKVESQLRRSKSHDRNSSSSSFLPLCVHLSEHLEPRQETLIDMVKTSNVHPLLVNYFEASLEACNTCELLLCNIHQTRANYRTIKRVIKLGKKVQEGTSTSTGNYEQCREIFEELAFFAMLENPLLVISSEKFGEIHNSHATLFDRLKVKSKKVRRRAKLARYCKKVLGFSIVVSCNAILIALLVISIHSMVGIIAAPGLFACSFSLVRGGLNKTSSDGRLGSQLEVAAKVVFILINDFDTMSRLVKRLEDEIEHCKAIADICVRSGKVEVLMEVVRELWIHKSCFLEQLKELEEHIYLSFLTINRSRMLVMQEVMVVQDEHERIKVCCK